MAMGHFLTNKSLEKRNDVEYLNHVLGIQIVHQNEELKSMPDYIYARYRIQMATQIYGVEK